MPNLVYPHIEFNQSSIGTIPQNSNWRSTIGVVGQFRRGPLLYRINGSTDFNRLYASDNSPGARAVRTMLAQGATDILISRAVSQETASVSKLAFYGLTPGSPAKIGYEGQVQQFHNGTPVKTTGISAEFNYIGEALGSATSFGTIKVLPTSKLNRALEYTGQSTISLSIQKRVSNSVSVQLATATTVVNQAYAATAATTFVTGAAGTLASLNALLSPQAAAPALAAGDKVATADGGLISITGTTYTVITGGALVLGGLALKTTTFAITNLLARLEVGSKFYFNNGEVATVVQAAEPTNLPLSVTVVTTAGAPIPSSSTLEAQAVIGRGIVTLKPSGVAGYQFLTISKAGYNAVVSNLTPGRALYSNSPAATFTAGTLTVLSEPLESLDLNVYKVLVKGQVTGTAAALAAGVEVSLYETPVSGYIVGVSTSALLKAKAYPDAVQWRTQLFQEETNTLLDSYEFLPEAYSADRLRVNFLFVEPDDTIRSIDSGLRFDVPAIETSGASAFLAGSNYTIPLVRTTVATGSLKSNGVDFVSGTSAAEVLGLLRTEILQNALLSNLLDTPVLSQTLQPPTLSLSSLIKGPQANRVYMEVSRKTSGEDPLTGLYANDLLLNSNNIAAALANWTSLPEATTPAYNSIYFTRGNSGSTSAQLDLYSENSDLLVKIVALSDGAYGNQIRVSVNAVGDGQFILNIVDLDSGTYQTQATTETLNLSTRDVDLTTGVFNATSNSGLIRAYYIPVLTKNASLTELELNQVPQRISPAFGQYIPTLDYVSTTGTPSPYSPAYQGATYLQGLFLKGGRDAALEADASSTQVGAAAMVRAVQALEAQDIAILLPAGIVIGDARYGSVVEECISQVNRSANLSTNRRLVLQAPANLNQNQAALYGAQLNSRDITLVAGTIGFTGISNSNSEPAAPLYAATLSLTSPQLSPAYAGNGVPLSGIISVDTPNTPQYLDAVTRAGVEALFFDPGLNQFKFLNGRTTSRNPKERLVTIRRVALQMMVDLNRNTLSLLSSQNDDQTRALVSSSFDSYLNSRVSAGWIQAFSPTICNQANNPLSVQAQQELHAFVSYTPYFPADIIIVDIVQQFSVVVG
jgi:hypothetical protein